MLGRLTLLKLGGDGILDAPIVAVAIVVLIMNRVESHHVEVTYQVERVMTSLGKLKPRTA